MSNNDITLSDLMEVTKAGFESVDRRFDEIDRRFERVYNRLDRVEDKVDRIEKIVDKWPAPSQVDGLFTRVKYIENKLDIKPNEAFQ